MDEAIRRSKRVSAARRFTVGTSVAIVLAIGFIHLSAVTALAAEPEKTLHLSLDLAGIQRLVQSEQPLSSLPSPAQIGADRIVAFEDQEHFTYLRGIWNSDGKQDSLSAHISKPQISRRVLFFRPDSVVVDDQICCQLADDIVWTLKAPLSLGADKQIVYGENNGLHYRCLLALPAATEWVVARDTRTTWQASHTIRWNGSDAPGWVRLLHIVQFAQRPDSELPVHAVEQQNGMAKMTIALADGDSAEDRTIRLKIPDGVPGGRIEVVGGDGSVIVPDRILPAGIMSPESNAAQRRLQWDLPYQIEGMATWDTKRPSSQLKMFVESGRIKPCRAVEIGCGTGNDAIHLAQQGFDVTAIDISPTALQIAERKARNAGVKVQWLLADILKPPILEKFDFVYDRGCYHEIRQHHAEDYIASVRKLTQAASKILILAGNANRDSYWRFHGPPRVREKDIRKDFSDGFQIVQLSEFRFDPAPADREGALAWCILLLREQQHSGGEKNEPQ